MVGKYIAGDCFLGMGAAEDRINVMGSGSDSKKELEPTKKDVRRWVWIRTATKH